jgi:hypothetical protein
MIFADVALCRDLPRAPGILGAFVLALAGSAALLINRRLAT